MNQPVGRGVLGQLIRSNNHNGAFTAAGFVRRGETMRQGDHDDEIEEAYD